MGERLHQGAPEKSQEQEVVEGGQPVAKQPFDMAGVDELLAKIDEILEGNPVEFVARFQQHGGQ